MRELILGMPDIRDLTPSELEEATDEALRLREWFAEQRRVGLTDPAILRRYADETGVPVAELEREAGAGLEL